jgi:hypothetical protein
LKITLAFAFNVDLHILCFTSSVWIAAIIIVTRHKPTQTQIQFFFGQQNRFQFGLLEKVFEIELNFGIYKTILVSSNFESHPPISKRQTDNLHYLASIEFEHTNKHNNVFKEKNSLA